MTSGIGNLKNCRPPTFSTGPQDSVVCRSLSLIPLHNNGTNVSWQGSRTDVLQVSVPTVLDWAGVRSTPSCTHPGPQTSDSDPDDDYIPSYQSPGIIKRSKKPSTLVVFDSGCTYNCPRSQPLFPLLLEYISILYSLVCIPSIFCIYPVLQYLYS